MKHIVERATGAFHRTVDFHERVTLAGLIVIGTVLAVLRLWGI